MIRAFQIADHIACVTGLVLPLELETQAQVWFEQFGGFSRGFTRSLFDQYQHHPKTPVFPYSAGKFGTGASFAFTAAFLEEIGGFDPALGSGSPSQGGEDLAAFFQVIKKGYTLVYEPSALIYHQHRHDYAALYKQIYAYGLGLTAYLTKIVLDNPIYFIELLTQIPFGCLRFLRDRLSINSGKKGRVDAHVASIKYPNKLILLEIQGMLHGPLAYLRGRQVIHRMQESNRRKMALTHFSSSRRKLVR